MKSVLNVAALTLLLGVYTPAMAATKTVTLAVQGMQCPVCPLTVRRP